MKTVYATMICAAFLVLAVVTWEQGRALARLEHDNALLRGRVRYLTTEQADLRHNAVACLTSLNRWVKDEKLLRKDKGGRR